MRDGDAAGGSRVTGKCSPEACRAGGEGPGHQSAHGPSIQAHDCSIQLTRYAIRPRQQGTCIKTLSMFLLSVNLLV